MNKIAVISKDLEGIKKIKNDLEYWSARDLMKVLGYEKWQKFEMVIKKAKSACTESNHDVMGHFIGTGKKISTGKTAQMEIRDFLLTRYACYLIAQNGDSRKPEIARAQTYFAVQTRKQEMQQDREKLLKRIEARERLKETERKIEGTVYKRGIKQPRDFAEFKDKYIRGLYGGMGITTLKNKRKIPKDRALADFDSFLELKAKDFALAMTDHNIKEKNLVGKPKLNQEVYENSVATRRTLLKRGILPEKLKPEEDVEKVKGKLSLKG
ncbi:DNA damage-inducible protein D [Candidatus Shapirobacteria bacterium]|nr:DNA damage-inducible protein D [Candidatus Shapirobacteria bacterium]